MKDKISIVGMLKAVPMEKSAILVVSDGKVEYPIVPQNEKTSITVLTATEGKPIGIFGWFERVDGKDLLLAERAYKVNTGSSVA